MSGTRKHKIIVGVDYGTTYTGASYVSTESNDIKDIIIISSWPGPTRDNETVFKAPSRIAYPADNERVFSRRWGFQVQPGMTAYSWTKLLLDENTPLTKYDDTNLENASAMGILKLHDKKNAVEVVSDFLSEVYKHILKTIARRIGDETLRITPIEFWFTVPAIWSDRAKHGTKKAAEVAGFGNSPDRKEDRIFMVTEPEAAAIACLQNTTIGGLTVSLEPGDGVLVCDCGGGTVDITTYLVNQTYPRLLFEELCTGTGGKCGSTAVDRNFYNLMTRRFGSDFDNLPLKRKSPGSEFMKKFELIKRDFGISSEEGMTHEVPLNMAISKPDPEYFNEEEGMVLLSNDDLRSIFDPVVDQVVELVQRQIADADREMKKTSTINRIILVGGFGDSFYLHQRFKDTFESPGQITVTIPDNPQAAIVKGAALRGLLGVQPATRRCRHHYGYHCRERFREGIDNEADACFDDFNGVKMARGYVSWLIRKGDKYSENDSRKFKTRKSHIFGNSLKVELALYSCDTMDRPKRREDKAVCSVGKIVMDFTDVELDNFPHKYVEGKLVYNLENELNVIFGSKAGVLKFECVSQGRVIGTTSINFAEAKYY